MKKNFKKVLALVLAGAMAVSMFAGCGKEAGSGQSGEVGAGIENFKAFKEKVTLEIPVYDRGAGSNGCKDVKDNYWTKWVQKEFGDKYNIDVVYVPITRSDVMNDYTMLAASQKLPTILAEYDYPKLMEWQAKDYLQEIDLEQFKKVAPTYWKAMTDNGLDAYTDTAGGHYFLLGTRAYAQTTYTWVTFYRRDWMDKVGVKNYPTTFDEWCDLYKKIKDAGLCEYPAGGTKIAGAGVDQNHSFRTYPQDEVLWATTGDYNIPALSTEAQKTLIKRENILYNLGYKDPDWYTKESSKGQEDFVAGKAFSWSGYVSANMEVLNNFYAQNPGANLDLVIASVNEDNDETGYSCSGFRVGNAFGAMLAIAFDATPDEVLAAEMYLEWMSQPENLKTFQWGLEGINYETVNGEPKAITLAEDKAEYQMGHNNNVDYWMLVAAIRVLGSIEKDVAAIAPVGLPEDFTNDIIANYYGQLDIIKAGKANPDCLFAGAVEAEAKYGTSLQELYATYRTQLTNCKTSEFESLYKELSEKYLKAGYQEVIDGRKKLYDEGKCTKLSK